MDKETLGYFMSIQKTLGEVLSYQKTNHSAIVDLKNVVAAHTKDDDVNFKNLGGQINSINTVQKTEKAFWSGAWAVAAKLAIIATSGAVFVLVLIQIAEKISQKS